MNQTPRHFLEIADLDESEINKILTLAMGLKAELRNTRFPKPRLKNKTLAMIFEKPSLRTRVSFETGMTQLGGHAIYLGPSDIQMGKRETVADVTGTLCRYVNIIMARVYDHNILKEMVKVSSVPIINALSDYEHPCQIMADLLTIKEHKKSFKGLKLAFVGDGENNVTHSLCVAAGLLGFDFRVANPAGFALKREVVDKARVSSQISGAKIHEFSDPKKAVDDADVVYTDTWVSMGDESEKAKRLKIFNNYQVTRQLMSVAKKDAVFMHDMPAYRGNEVSAEVIDGPQSIIFDQAENRLHAQKAIMSYLLKHTFKK